MRFSILLACLLLPVSAFAADPDWVRSGGTSIKYPAETYLTGFSMAPDTSVDAEVDLGTSDGSYLLQARLKVSLPGFDPEQARALVEEAHQTCPYSKATRGNIHVELIVA